MIDSTTMPGNAVIKMTTDVTFRNVQVSDISGEGDRLYMDKDAFSATDGEIAVGKKMATMQKDKIGISEIEKVDPETEDVTYKEISTIDSTRLAVGEKTFINTANTGAYINANSGRIVNVANGTENSDAVNLAQLKGYTGVSVNNSGTTTALSNTGSGIVLKAGDNAALAVNGNEVTISSLGGTDANAVHYDSAAKESVTLGGTGASKLVALKNVAAGGITAGSTNAVNGGEIYAELRNGISSTNYISAANTTAVNLSNLDKQVKTNADNTITGFTQTGTAICASTAAGSAVKVADNYDWKVTGGTVTGTGTDKKIQLTQTDSAGNTDSSVEIDVSDISGSIVSEALEAEGNLKKRIDTSSGSPVAYFDTIDNTTYNSVTAVEDRTAPTGAGKTYSQQTAGGITVGHYDTDGSTKITDSALTKDTLTVGGVNYITASGLNANNNRITNVAAATNDNDAANFGQVVNASAYDTATGKLTLKHGDTELTSVTIPSINFATAKGVSGNVSPTATQDGALAVGYNSTAGGEYSTVVGFGSTATGTNSIAIGKGHTVSGNNSGAFGDPNNVSGSGSYAIGNNNTIGGDNTFVLGSNVAAGTYTNSVVLGNGSAVNQNNVVSVGGGTQATNRKIINLGYGTADSDAAAFGQVVNASAYDTATGKLTLKHGNTELTSVVIPAGSGGSIDFATAKGVSGNVSPTATKGGALGVGYNATAGGEYSTAVGFGTNATGMGSIAAGFRSVSLGSDSIAAGHSAYALADSSIAIGANAAATDYAAIAIGTGACASENYATAIGNYSCASGELSFAAGAMAKAEGEYSMAAGYGATAAGVDSTALGSLSQANGKLSTAFGYLAQATHNNSVALGSNSVTGGENEVSVGSSTLKRKITNVADGEISKTSTDAINGSQLYDTNQSIINLGDEMNIKFGDVNTKIGDINTEIGGINVKIGDINTDIGGIQVKMGDINTRIDNIDLSVENINNNKADKTDALKKIDINSTGVVSQTTVSGSTSNVAQLVDTSVRGISLNKDTKMLSVMFENKYNGEYAGEKTLDVEALINTKVDIKGSMGNISTSNGIVSTKTKRIDEKTGLEVVDVDMKIGENFTITDPLTKNYTNYTTGGIQVSNAAGSLQSSLGYGQLAFKNGDNTASLSTDGLTFNGKTYVSDSGLNANNQKIVYVAPGEISENSTDAVNGSQLFATNSQVNINTINIEANTERINNTYTKSETRSIAAFGNTIGVTYNDNTYNTITLSGKGGTTITNVKAGDISINSTDVVIGSQLYETNMQIEATNKQLAATNIQLAATNKEVQEVGAMSAALAGLHYMEPTGEGDDKVTGAVAYGGYKGENAAAVGIAYKPNQNLMFSASTSIGNSQQAYNAGMSFRFGKGNTAATRAALQKQVKYMNDKLESANAKIDQQDATIRTLLNRLETLEKKVQ